MKNKYLLVNIVLERIVISVRIFRLIKHEYKYVSILDSCNHSVFLSFVIDKKYIFFIKMRYKYHINKILKTKISIVKFILLL